MTDQQLIAQLLGALNGVMPYVVTQEVTCHGLKCRESVCSSCSFDWEDAVTKAQEAYVAANAAIAAAEARDGGLPDGWVFCTADFSLQAAGKSKTGSVLLIRDHDGRAAWHKLSEEDQEIVPLYMSGVGNTVQEAIADAAKRALLAKGDV